MRTERASWKGVAGRGAVRLALVLAAVTVMTAVHQPAFAERPGPDTTAATALARQPAAAAGPVTLTGAPPGAKVITLVTGDRVRLSETGGGHYRYDVTPAPRDGGAAPVFYTQAGPDGFFVLPSDAVPAIRAGRLDRTLFDVKYLAEHGYADGQTGQVPVIVQYPTTRTTASVGASAQALPASTATRTLASLHGAAVTVPKAQAAEFWSAVRGTPAGSRRGTPEVTASTLGSGLTKVWLDRKVYVDLNESVPLIGAPQAWAAGYDGTGVKVAILDTGIDDTHQDLAGKVAESRTFVPDVPSARDDHGHGTHVASTIAGSGTASGGKYKGVAPGASLVIGKVLNGAGEGDFSWIIAGMEWAATSGAKVVSMSLSGGPTDGTDPVSQAVNDLTAQTGTLFVIAASNAGPAEGTIGTPGAADSALTVAATSKTDELADFSSRGPRVGDSGLKPDIAAPGVNIVAARAAGTELGPIVDENYTSLSGTSMATPHVAGAAAILAQQHADWTATQLKPALMSTSKDVGLSVYQRGAGRLDVARAVRQTVFATTANLDFGSVPDGQPPASKPLTYTNLGDQPVTLTLTPALRTGDTSTDSALTVDQTTLTVPARGATTATVTLDPSALARGQYTGAVVATDEAGDHLTTPVGLVREPPTVTLTIHTLGRDGQPADPGLVDVVDVTGIRGRLTDLSLVDTGVLKVRVPEGTVSVSEWMSWVDEDSQPNNVQLLDPQVTVSGDTEITLDARAAVPVTFEVPGSEARPLNNDYAMNYQRSATDGQRYWASVSSGGNYGATARMWATPTETVTQGGLEFSLGRTMGRPEVEASVVRPQRIALDAVQPLNFLGPDGEWMENSIYPGFIPFTGTQDLTVVDVGTGSPEEIAGRDLTGKLTLMAAPGCFAPIEWMNAIRDAGAAAVAMYGGENSGCPAPTLPEKLNAEVPSIGIRNLSLPSRQGVWLRDLAAREPVTVRVSGDPVTPYVYYLTPFEQGRIPSTLHYWFSEQQLGWTDLRLHGDPATMGWWVNNVSVTRDSFIGQGGSLATPHASSTLREYVGPLSPDILHFREVGSFDLTGRNDIRDRSSSAEVFDRPFRRVEHRLTGLATPGPDVGPDFYGDTGAFFGNYQAMCMPCRDGDTLFVNTLGRSVNRDFYETNLGSGGLVRDFASNTEFHLYRDGVELPRGTTPGLFTTYTLPEEEGNYRLTADGKATHATWTFTSARSTTDTKAPGSQCIGRFLGVPGGACGPAPMVFVSYDFGDDIALDNTMAAGGRRTFTVDAYHAPSTVQRAPIAGVRVWASTDDGAHWTPLTVRGVGDGTFSVTADVPAYERTTGSVSLKAEAWDADGNSVSLTTLMAVALRPADHHTDHHTLRAS